MAGPEARRPSDCEPTFDEWVDYCFRQGYADFHGGSSDGDDGGDGGEGDSAGDPAGGELARARREAEREARTEREAREAREARFGSLAPATVAEYLTRLFESPAFVAERYTDDEIASGTWYLFSGSVSNSLWIACRAEVPPERATRCLRAVATLYLELFDRVCGRRGAAPDLEPRDPVDAAVFMIWDMGQIEHLAIDPEGPPERIEAGIFILKTVLRSCRTAACIQSALHGIGHGVLMARSGERRNTALAERLQRLVDELLARRELPGWLREYARVAREGQVQ